MSKTTAHKTPANKPAAKKAAAPAKKSAPASKKAALAHKPAPVKAASGAKAPAAKPAARPGAKPGAKTATKTAAKTAVAASKGGKPAPAPAHKGAKPAAPAPKPTAHAPAPKPVAPKARAAAPKPVAPGAAAPAGGIPAAPAPVVPKKALSSRASARAAATPAQAPLPLPTSRFADRFAPPRPPTRQMAQVEVDTPRRVQVSDPKLANAWKSKAGRDLTEAELLAMPESEYMNDKQLEFFRYTLMALKNSLLSNAGETTEHLREDTSIVPDPADRATIEEEHALELRTRDRERKLLKKITQSLSRIEASEYGFCDETGEPIGLGRLIARPTATLSLEAQQRRELKQKMFGD